MNRWQRNRERALDEMTQRIIESRKRHPNRAIHAASVRTSGGLHNLTVHAAVPVGEIRTNLEAQLASINGREGF